MPSLETPISKAARELLTTAGFRVTRINSGRVKVRRGWMHNAEAGTPDLLVEVVAPVYGWLEAKRPKGPMRKAQEKWHAEAKARGCLVAVFETAREALLIAIGWRDKVGGKPRGRPAPSAKEFDKSFGSVPEMRGFRR